MKKIFSLALSVMMVLAMVTCVSATEIHLESEFDDSTLMDTISINEYDLYEESKPDDSISEHSIGAAESALLARAQLPEKTLIGYGYSDEEISILKAYDGSPITENPELRGLFADLTVRLYRRAYSNHGVTVRFFWDWEKAPVLHSFVTVDNISCGWVGVDSKNKPHPLRFEGKNSVCEVEYYDGDKSVGREKLKIDDVDVNSCVQVAVPMGEPKVNGGWSKRGYMDVTLAEPVPTNDLAYSTVAFAYGHMTSAFGGNASFSVDLEGLNISFNPGSGTEEMFNGSISIWTNGYFECNGDAA